LDSSIKWQESPNSEVMVGQQEGVCRRANLEAFRRLLTGINI